MPRFKTVLPNIDYGVDAKIEYPQISNQVNQVPEVFARWGSGQQGPQHCFVDDWRIEAIWRHKFKMVEKVIMSGCAIAPDFTVEHDSPLVHAIHQVWRSRVVARYWQDHGVYVIPALQWSRPEINKHLFQGLEKCAVVAVRSPTRGTEDQWYQCAGQFLQICRPELVLHFGTKRGLDIWPNSLNLSLKTCVW